MPVQLKPHQEDAIAKMKNGCILYGDVGVGKTITSLGYYVTRVANGEINKWGSLKTPKDVYVITTAKVRDGKGFDLTALKYGISSNRENSTNGVKITVDSWNNIAKYVGVENAFFIFDEQRVVGYGKWSRSFIKIAKANEWILLSGTPGDTWLDYIPVFVANGWYKHKTDFLDQHVIWTPRVRYPKVLRYQNPGLLVRRRNEVLVHMPYDKHTVRHGHEITCDYDLQKFEKVVKKKWHVYEERPLRDAGELFSVMRKVVNTDSSRVQAIQDLLSTHPKLIVFYNFDYELEMLRTLGEGIAKQTRSFSKESAQIESSVENPSSETCPGHWTEDKGMGEEFYTCRIPKLDPCLKNSATTHEEHGSASTTRLIASGSNTAKTSLKSPQSSSKDREIPLSGEGKKANLAEGSSISSGSFAVAEWNGHKHEAIPATKRWLYLVQYRAGAEGWDCIDTDAICFFSQTYSYRDWIQAHGRIDRLNTPFIDLHYYYLVSTSLIDKAIRRALKTKKNFNERDLVL